MTSLTNTAADALAALRRLTGRDDVTFHPGQLEAIEALVEDRRRALVVQRTGWGKSAVYFIATALRRAAGAGPTVLVSPLLALMRDQVAAAERAGVRAVSISSANVTEWEAILQRLGADEVDVVLLSPERLNNPRFRDEQLPQLIDRTGLLVVDEAHCISDWGHDFRPDYRRLAQLIERLAPDVPVLATTATANARVVADIADQLGSQALTLRGSLARSSLRLGVLELAGQQMRLGWLAAHLSDLPGSGIVYTLTVSAAEDTARVLREAGHDVRAYTGRTDPAEREQLEGMLKDDAIKALVATSALGMGFDKPNLGFVVHLGAPSSPVAYYQQVGRAGRSTESADVLLLPGREDPEIWSYFATASMPDPEQARAVIDCLGAEPLSTPAIETRVDIRRTRLELLLKVLDVDGAVMKVPGGWVATGRRWSYDTERYQNILAVRRAEQDAMREYQAGASCRMEFLQRQLDDPTAAPCGRCDVCTAPWYPIEVPAAAAANATDVLDRVGVPVEPRSTWPAGMARLGVDVKGRIRPQERAETGRVLARLTDLGWGGRLRELFVAGAADTDVDEDLLGACARALRDWGWTERPVAVVAMASVTRPRVVRSLAQGLARIGRLPLLGELDVDPSVPVSGPGGNSAYRLAGLWGRFRVGTALADSLEATTGPVLLVDDLVDTRWTLTVAARELRRSGADAVLPFALAQQG